MRRIVAGLVVLLAAGGALAVFMANHRSGIRARGPSIVLILTDDQRWDTLWAMPNVRKQLGGRGVTFTNGFVVNPLCCPSRSSILTGRYSHSTGLYANRGPHGGFAHFDDRSTIATWLDDAGYTTGYFGKYLNGYQDTTEVPPGWDRWFAIQTVPSGSGYYFDWKAVE